jgi:hypothetical protein
MSIFDFWVTSFKNRSDFGCHLVGLELHPRTRQLIQGGSRRSSLLAILRQQILGRHDKNFPPAA